MGLAPELGSHLQAARPEALVPALAGLGVEAIADLGVEGVPRNRSECSEYSEYDLENHASSTTLQKRLFCDSKMKTVGEQSSYSIISEAQQSNPKKTISDSEAALATEVEVVATFTDEIEAPEKVIAFCPKSTVLSICSKPEALHPYGSQPRGTALDVDFYKIFGNPSLSAHDVKCLYNDFSKQHHPDNGGDAEVFSHITEAYYDVVDPFRGCLLMREVTPPPLVTRRKLEEGRGSSCVPSSSAGALLDKSAGLHTDKPFMPKRRGFRESLKLCLPLSRRAYRQEILGLSALPTGSTAVPHFYPA